jgi:nanoRNase/pAp phosphatase (c-di-AMP/oligoRNAs hydrolase)
LDANAPWQSDRIAILIGEAADFDALPAGTVAASVAASTTRIVRAAGSQNRRLFLLTYVI